MSTMTEKDVETIEGWGQVFNKEDATLMAPGLLAGVMLLILDHKVDSVLTLPAALLAIIVMFYVVLFASGSNLEDARTAYGTGWVGNTTDEAAFWDSWKYV